MLWLQLDTLHGHEDHEVDALVRCIIVVRTNIIRDRKYFITKPLYSAWSLAALITVSNDSVTYSGARTAVIFIPSKFYAAPSTLFVLVPISWSTLYANGFLAM